MATISFHTNGNPILSSGLGFYGSSFGASVNVSEYQQTTFITDPTGTVQNAQGNNVKFINAQSGIVGSSSSGINLLQIPNFQATLNIRFEHTVAVNTQNAKLRIYDRSNINNPASGVTTKVAEIIHPDVSQATVGSGDQTWITPAGSAIIVDFIASPNVSGIRPGTGTSTRHDFFAAISASPDSVGSKTLYGAYFSLEYL